MSSVEIKKQIKNPIIRKFGRKIKLLRNKKGLSQVLLADKAGLHWTYISGIERGLRNISLINVYKIAKALKVKPQELLES